MATAGDSDGTQRLCGVTVFDGMTLLNHGVAGGRGEPSIHRIVAARSLVGLLVAAARVVRVANQRGADLSGGHRGGGEGNQADVGRPALVPRATDFGLDAKRLAHLLAVHELTLRGRRL